MTSDWAGPAGHEGRAVAVFVRWDLIGTVAGLVLVVAVNSILARPQLWLIAATLVALLGALTLAGRLVERANLLGSLTLVAIGNWVTAIVVAAVLPFLWPVMAITVLMPLVLASPYLTRSRIGLGIASAALMAGLVGLIGLVRDDGGALPDLADEVELVVVAGALMAQIAPIGLIVWQNNRLQRNNLDRAVELNAELEMSRERLAASRRRVVEAADAERQRIERNLHDGAQQRLVAIGVRLRLLETLAGDDLAVNGQITTLIDELDEAVNEVRELAHGIYPPLLQTRGLVDALTAVARRSPLPITTDLDDVGRIDPSAEATLYFTALEALANAAKHAPEASVVLSLRNEDTQVRLCVQDDGPGFDADASLEAATHGLTNMADRVASNGGTLAIRSAPGQGTVVDAAVAASPPAI